MPDPGETARRNRSSTVTAKPPTPTLPSIGKHPAHSPHLSSTPRNVTEPLPSVAAAALSSHLAGSAAGAHSDTPVNNGTKRPRLSSSKTSHARVDAWTSPPPPLAPTIPSAPSVPTRGSLDYHDADPLFPATQATLLLYTYRPNNLNSSQNHQPAPLPSLASAKALPSTIHFSYSALPWRVQPGDYVEIRRIHRNEAASLSRTRGIGHAPPGPGDGKPSGGEALRGVAKGTGRDTFIFRVGEDCPSVPINQIQVPETVAAAFRLQHRSEVEVVKMFDTSEADIDFVELRFSQYLGRADMWRLAMSLEGSTVHVGERLSLAGGAVRAEVQGIWRNQHRHASGILTAKSKTIYRSKSAQVYLFIQICQETWEFDEDGERYYEKVVHGFLPELFARWNEKGTSHLVTIILFARVHYTDDEVEYMEKNDIADGLMKDYAGRACKDFFRVVIDFERRSDWNLSLAEIKRRVERSEREILLQYHVNEIEARHPGSTEQKRILGKWSFAYEGNVLEAVNLALNPFDEHYIDRDLSRTGLNIAIITPGTGHFAVDKNLLRMTTERMIDHGNCLELICLTKMPLHSVPLFSYVSKRPKKPVWEIANTGVKTKPATPDLLYFDSHLSSATDCELADCYSIPKWVNSSYYSKTHDKPFRKDRFIPRCKMYEIQMLGILDHNLTTVTVPLLDMDDLTKYRKDVSSMEERKAAHDEFDANIFRPIIPDDGRSDLTPIRSRESGALSTSINNASYQSARLLATKAAEEEKAADKAADPHKDNHESVQGDSSIKQTSSTTAGSSPHAVTKAGRSGSTSSRSPLKRIQELSPFDPLELVRTDLRAVSPAPSSLSLGRTATTRPRSASRVSELSAGQSSGQSSPKSTPARKLNTKSSKSSFGSRLGNNWLLTALSGRSQPSFPAAAAETVGRQDYVSVTGSTVPSPVSAKASPALPRPVPGAPIITPSTPTPTKANHKEPDAIKPQSASTTQPLPIATTRSRAQNDEEPIKSLKNSYKASKSPMGDSWAKAAAANFNRGKSHVTVNPCNPKENDDTSFGEGRRWQHVKPKPGKESQHLVKWTALTAPACLPLTTDFMPTTQEIQDFYELNSYDIACYPDQVSFLVRADAAHTNLPLAVMREMASQRLSQNFQFITLPHTHDPIAESDGKVSSTRKVLLPGDSTKDGLKAGGASEVLRSATGAIYLLWSNHIHRLAFDSTKQSVTVQRFVRKLRYSVDPVRYNCLVWPAQMSGYQQANAVFKYPNVEAKLNFNYLDRLIAGEEENLTANLRYWRTRYILIPSGRDPVAGVVPKGEQFNQNEILISGAFKVLEVIGKNQWKREPGAADVPMRLLATTFDPSACVLDDGLMIELERLNRGEEQHPAGKALEGMTLQTVAEMMCQPNNGLVIRDRWWNFHVHEDSFTGEQFCDWLLNTFTDIKTIDEAAEWGRSLFDKGLIEHVTGTHGFFNYGHFFYRLRREYNVNKSKLKRPAKGWFGGKPAEGPRDLLERHAAISATLQANEPLGKLGEGSKKHKRKIKMSQSVIIDLDPAKKSDRAEVAMLHADIIHNAKNAFHFELNWLGVTAGLLDELRAKCAAQAERYGLRFVEAPVEQIKDQSKKCAYRAAIPIPLALAPPVFPDLHLRLAAQGISAQISNWFEYAILTHKFGFVLDVEATSRYPDNVEVQYSYRGATPFEHSQFCHRSGLALVQCLGGTDGYLWSDNRLFIAAPTRGRGGGTGTAEAYPNMPVPAKLTKQEEARALRMELQAFCGDAEGLRRFYEEITPPAVSPLIGTLEGGEGDKGDSNGAPGVEADAAEEKSGDGEVVQEKEETGAKGDGNETHWTGSDGQRSESPVDIRHSEESS